MTDFDRELLEEMFENVRKNTDWRIDADECLWGYFFTDYDEARLEKAGQALEAEGYRFVSVFGKDDEDIQTGEEDGPPLLWLHVEKIERHSVDSLMRRNNELNAFADGFGLHNYDGMDVGPVE